MLKMNLKDIFKIISDFTKVSLHLKIKGVWLKYDGFLLKSFYEEVKDFYDFKVTKLDTDIVNSDSTLVVYAEDN